MCSSHLYRDTWWVWLWEWILINGAVKYIYKAVYDALYLKDMLFIAVFSNIYQGERIYDN